MSKERIAEVMAELAKVRAERPSLEDDFELARKAHAVAEASLQAQREALRVSKEREQALFDELAKLVPSLPEGGSEPRPARTRTEKGPRSPWGENRRRILAALSDGGGPYTARQIADRLSMPATSVGYTLQNLLAEKAIDASPDGKGWILRTNGAE